MASVEHQAATGELVALEGDIDTISTQLRLLPPSQKILILPSLVENITKVTREHPFKPRAFIREVHELYTSRIETARSFLQSSTNSHPRLVLMNGGSVGARTACIASICENITNGDIDKAEIVFDDIVKDGVVGVLQNEDVDGEYGQSHDRPKSTAGIVEKVEEREEDPTVKAMKAADYLDRETAALQEDGVADGDVTIVDRVELSHEDPKEIASGKQAKTTEDTNDVTVQSYSDNIRTTEVTVPGRKDGVEDGLSTFGGTNPRTPFSAATYLTARHSYTSVNDDDEDEYDTDLVSPISPVSPDEDMFSVPPTPRVEYGEACIVDVQATLAKKPTNQVKRPRSMEELYHGRSRVLEISLSPRKLRHSRSEYHFGGRPTSANGRIEDPHTPEYIQLPQTTFVRASTTTIRKSQSFSGTSSSSTPTLRLFVDRGSDAWDGQVITSETVSEEIEFYEPVFPAVEDLVIHCVDDAPNEILGSVFRSYKDGIYPPRPNSPASDADRGQSPTNSNANADEDVANPSSDGNVETSHVASNDCDEFDPYSSDINYAAPLKQNIPISKFARIANEIKTPEPPSTKSRTPPAPRSVVHEKFCEFSLLAPTSVIGIQNSLRAFFNSRFPAGDNGYTQYYFAISPEADRLWKPVFRNDETASIGDEGRTVDQIIALGCEDGVKKEFFSQICGQVERLGTKKDGLSRSGKLDLRYLVSYAMQTFATLPLITQGKANPLSDATLLATLLIPQIETYLATNPSIRLLILIYPSSHLPTVVALRRLLGQDILKIAGILDTLSSDPPSYSSRPRTPTTHPLSNESSPKSYKAHHRRGSRKSSGSQVSQKSLQQSKKAEFSFSKANYLLPSTATDSEIATFLSGIWMPLVEKSAFYTPEPEPEPIVIEKVVERLIEKAPVTSPKQANSPKQGRESKISRLTGNVEKRSHHYAPSIASTVRTMTTMRTTVTERARMDERELERAWEDFYIGEVDSEDDAYDRMVMGRSGARIVPEVVRNVQGKKRSSKKALQWLGLA